MEEGEEVSGTLVKPWHQPYGLQIVSGSEKKLGQICFCSEHVLNNNQFMHLCATDTTCIQWGVILLASCTSNQKLPRSHTTINPI